MTWAMELGKSWVKAFTANNTFSIIKPDYEYKMKDFKVLALILYTIF